MRFLYLIPACVPLYWKLGSAFSPLFRIFMDSSLALGALLLGSWGFDEGLAGVLEALAKVALAVAFSSFCVGVLVDFGIETP